MEKGTLVRLISQDVDTEWVSCISIEKKDRIGVVIEFKKESNWISGHGPLESELCLVSWSDGSIRWVDITNLTSYGL